MLLYLQAAMYYFVYYINTRRLYRQPLRRLYYQPNKVSQKASDTQQLIDDINQRILYDKHFSQSSFHEKALRFSQIFIFCFHRDIFIKFLKIITANFVLVNNSCQFCTKYFCIQNHKCPVKFGGALDLIPDNQFWNNKICSFLIWKRCWFTQLRWVCSYVVESRTRLNGHPSHSCFHSLAFSHRENLVLHQDNSLLVIIFSVLKDP